MKANEFVKKYGWDYSKHLVGKLNINDTFYLNDGGSVSVMDMQILVNAYEFINKLGINKNNINEILQKSTSDIRHKIKHAWYLVESCT